ncbi:MAG TPA: hypothetical protein VFE05_19330 [Longimicrobiaceae bacterium]|jgi:hypothetical protein|nr:hypothetical protein [Longimicrobiaceae bacterium]
MAENEIDAMAMVRAIRDRINEETKGMSSEEFRAYIAQRAALLDNGETRDERRGSPAAA